MITLLKKIKQMVLEELAHYQQLRVNAENEYQVMSCGALNPRLLARVRSSKAGDNNKKHADK